MMKGVIYARYSCSNQSERSIEGQLEDCTNYAKANNIQIIGHYIDRAQTGTNDNRDGFQRMIQDSGRHQFDCVVTWKIDRFGRNREELAINKVKLKKNGVQLRYANEHIPDGPEGVILESVLEGMAEYYSMDLSQKVRRGMHTKALTCKYNGGCLPFGYRIDSDANYVPDEKSAPVIAEIFSLYDSGHPFVELADHLNAKGLRTSMGKPFSVKTMRGILENEKYIGVYKFADVRVEDGVPAIVDKDLFFRVQKKLALSKRGVRNKKTRYLLAGKVFCESCGSPYITDAGTSSTGTVHAYYTCKNRRTKKGCLGRSLKKESLESLVLDYARRIIFDDALIDLIADRAMAIYDARKDNTVKNALIQKKFEVEKGLSNIVKAIEMGIISDTTRDRLLALESQKKELEQSISEEDFKMPPMKREAIIWYIKHFRDCAATDAGINTQIIQSFIAGVSVGPESVTIIFNYSENEKNFQRSDIASFPACAESSCDLLLVTHTSPKMNYSLHFNSAFFNLCIVA